jgi:peptidoglycan biosynthesis protein MviN/MurJ (putative lipid II flippase)
LGYGQFGWRDTRLTAASLGLFAVSIAAQSLILLFARAFYAAGKTLRPIMVNIISLVFIIGGIFIFMKLLNISANVRSFLETILRVKDVQGVEMLILPLVFSIGMIFNAIFLVRIFQKDFGEIWLSVRKTFFQVILASVLMGLVTFSSLNVLDKIFNIRTFIGIFFQGFISAIFGLGVWYMVLRSAKNKELKEIIVSLKQKFWKTSTIASEPEELP